MMLVFVSQAWEGNTIFGKGEEIHCIRVLPWPSPGEVPSMCCSPDPRGQECRWLQPASLLNLSEWTREWLVQPAHHQAEAGGEYPNGCGNPVQWQLRKEDTQNTHQHGDCLFLLWHLLQHPEGLSPALNRKGTLKLKTDRNTPPPMFSLCSLLLVTTIKWA